MDIVLGVSMTTATVRMVLVEGEKADGVTVESEVFDTAAASGLVKGSPSEQVSAAIVATAQSALSGGHHLVVSGVTWVDQPESAALRDSIAARGLDNVVLVPEQSAAGALAQTVGRALGYDTTGVILVKPGTVTLSIVDSADGSIVEARTRSTRDIDPADVLPELVSVLEDSRSAPRGVFLVGSGLDVRSIKPRLESLISEPVIVPEEPEWALARGAALAAANAPGFEASTSGLAYSQDPDPSADEQPAKFSDADTEVAAIDCSEIGEPAEPAEPADDRKRHGLLMPVGSLVAGFFVVAVVALVMSLAVSIRPTVEQGSAPDRKESAPIAVLPPPVTHPPAAVLAPPAPPVAQPAPPQAQPAPPQAQPAPPPPTPAPASLVAQAASALPVEAPDAAPAPVVQQPPPRQRVATPEPVAAEAPVAAAPVAVDTPVPQAPPPPAPVALPPPAPAPIAPPPPPAPIALPPPPAPIALPPPPAPIALPPPAPALASPPLAAAPPLPASLPPVAQPAAQAPPVALSPFGPPSVWIRPQQEPEWVHLPLGLQQQPAQPPQQLQPGPQFGMWPQRQPPPAPRWTPPQPSAQLPPLGPPTQPTPWQQQSPYGSPDPDVDGAPPAGSGSCGGHFWRCVLGR
jgi:hypothetical protein